MAIDFKTLIGIAYDTKQAESATNKQIKSLQKNAKLSLGIELSDKEAKKVLQSQSKAWSNYRKEAVSALTATNTELQKMGQYYKNEEAQIQKTLAVKKKAYSDELQAYKINESLKQAEIKKTAKISQDSLNLKTGKVQLDNNISTYIKNNAKLTTDLKNRLVNLQTELKDVDNVGLSGLKKEFSKVKSEANALGKTGDTVFSKLGKNVNQFIGFLGSATLVMSGINAIKNMVTEVKTLDSAFISLKKVTDETDATYKRFLNTAVQSAQELGSSVSDVVEMTATWAKLGYTINEASELAKTSTIYANVADITDTNVAVSDLVTAMKAYNITADDSITIADKFNEIGNKYATDAASLGDGLKNAASSLALAGNSIDESLAMLTSMTEITQNASESGNSLKVLSMRIKGMKGDLEALGEESEGVEAISKIQTQILNLTKGKVNIFDDLDPTKFKSTYDIMLGISKVWKDMSEVDQAQLLETIAGKQRGNSVAALIQSMSQAENVLQTSLTSSGSALAEQQKYMQSIEYSADRMKASFQALSANTLDSGWIKLFYDLANTLVVTTDKVGLFNVAILATLGILNAKKGIVAVGWVDTLITKMGIATTSATGLRFALSAMVPAGLIIAGLTGIYKAYEFYSTALERQIEKLEETKTAYAESKTELESINSELTTTIARMKELNEKENLTFVEESELEKLKEVNKTLLIQQDILKKQNELNAREVASTTLDTFNKVYGGSNISQSQVLEYVDTATSSGNNAILASDENNISSMIAAYQQFNKLKEEAYSAENNDDIQHYSELLDEISSSLYTNIDDLNSYKSTLESIPYEQLTQEQKSALEEINNAIGLIYTNIAPEDWKQIQFEDIISTKGIDEAISKVKELADTQPITKEQVENSKDLMEAIGATGLTAEEFTVQLNAMNSASNTSTTTNGNTTESLYALAEAAKEATGYVNDLGENVSVEKLQGVITDAQTSVQDFKEILKSMDDNNGLTLDGLQKITQKYPQLLSYVGDEKQLREQLKKGIEDQNKTAEQYYKDVLELDTNFFNTIIDNNSKLVNKLSEYYGIDIKNFQSLANAKNETEITLLNSLTKKWGEYYKAQEAAAKIAQASATTQTNLTGSGLFLGDGGFGDLAIENANKMTEERRKAAETESKMYSQIKDLFVNTDYTGDLVSGLSGLTNPDTSKTKKTFSEVFDWISIRIEKLQKKAQKTVDSISKYISYKTKNSKIDIAVNTKINEKTSLESIQKSYEKLAKDVKLPKEYMDLVNSGGMNVETITDEKLADKIKEYQKWTDAASSVADQIEGITEEIKALNSQKLDVISAYFGDRTDYIGSKISRRESYISNKEASGKKITESDYNYLIQLQNDIISNTKKELDAFSSVFNQQVKDGLIKKGTAEYYEGLKTINDLTIKSRETQSAIYDLNTEIRSVRWDNFDKGITSINNVKDELNDLASMIDNEDAIGEGGIFTSEGITKVGLYAQQLQENNKLISEYQVAINSLSKELKNGVITQEQYDEELVKYQKLQRQAVLDNKSLENSIADLAKERIQSEIKTLEEQTEAFKKSTDAQKDALQAQKDLYEYQKSIDKKNSNINVLQKQIATLSLSDDRKDIAQRLKLEKELKEKQTELEDEQTKHSIDSQLDSYDNDYDNYKSSQDSKVKTLEKSLEDQETLVKNALDEAFKNTQIISAGIQSLASEHGINVTTSVVSPWQSAASALEVYKQALSTLQSSTSINTNSVTPPLNVGIGASAGIGTVTTKTSTSSTSSQSSTTKSNTGSNAGMVSSLSGNIQYGQSGNNVSKLQSALKALGYNIGSAGVDGKFGDKTLSAVRQFQSDNAITVDGVVGDKTKAKFKLKGYKDGIAKILEDQLAWTQENGDELIVKPSSNSILTPLSAGDGVIKADLTKNLMDWGKYNPSNMASLSGITSLTSSKGGQPISIKYDNLITVNGNLDKSVDIEGIVNRAIDKQQSNLITLMKQYK